MKTMLKFLKKLFLFPILAVFSRKFYISVICYFRGFGQGHFLRSCGLAAVVAAAACFWQLADFYAGTVLPGARRAPDLYYRDGRIEAARPEADAAKWAAGGDGEEGPAYVFRYEDGSVMLSVRPATKHVPENVFPSFEFREDAEIRPVLSLYRSNFCYGFSGYGEAVCINYDLFMPAAEEGYPTTAEEIVRTLNRRMITTYAVIATLTLWLLIMIHQAVYILFTTLISLLLQIIVKIGLPKDALIRLNVYANTFTLALFAASMCFIGEPQVRYALTSEFTLLIPLFYIWMALSDFRNNLIVSVRESMKGGRGGPAGGGAVPGRGDDGGPGGAPGESGAPENVRGADPEDGDDDGDKGVFTP